MSRVMQAWENVLREAVSSDFDEQQFALLQIGMVLQRHNPQLTMESDAEEETLSRELLRLSLNEQRQSETVQYLITLVRNHPKQADIFLYALSYAQAQLLANPLLELLHQVGSKFNADAIFQALTALNRLYQQRTHAVIAQALQTHDILPLLEIWADHPDDTIAHKANRLMTKLIAMRANEDNP